MRKLPETILTASEEYVHSDSCFKATCEEYTRDFQEAEVHRFEATNQSRKAKEMMQNYYENYENSSLPSNVSVMPEEIMTEIEGNMTMMESGNMSMMYGKVKEGIVRFRRVCYILCITKSSADLDLWSSTAEGRLSEQNSRGMESIIAPYQREILNRTGLTLDVYVSDLVDNLSIMYEGVEPDDEKHANATVIVNSLQTIKTVS